MNDQRFLQKRFFNILLVLVLVASFVTPVLAGSSPPPNPLGKPVIFFASDGLRQDLAEAYANPGIDASRGSIAAFWRQSRPTAVCSPRRRPIRAPAGTPWRPAPGRRAWLHQQHFRQSTASL